MTLTGSVPTSILYIATGKCMRKSDGWRRMGAHRDYFSPSPVAHFDGHVLEFTARDDQHPDHVLPGDMQVEYCHP